MKSVDVGHCADPGCYSRSVNYYATARQMTALAYLSNECHQSISVCYVFLFIYVKKTDVSSTDIDIDN